MVEETPPSADLQAARAGPTATAAQIVKQLRQAIDWQPEIDDVLNTLGMALDVHRTILFRLRELPDRGFAQSIAAYWTDSGIPGIGDQPTLIVQEIVKSDPLLAQLAEEVRQGKMFVGHTRELEGFLRGDFEEQKIKSFLSLPVFAHGHLWGTLAINDCMREREWTADETAATEIVALAIGDAIERAESDAHVSEVIRAAMLRASLDAVVVIDETGSIIEFNPAAEKIFGWTKEEILGKDVLHTLIPEFYGDGYASGDDYMAGRGAPMIGRRIETVSRSRSGEIIPIELTASEVKVAGRHLFLGSMRDLREKRQAEEEINRQREKLHQNEKLAAMGSLLAGVSHELNNPLAVVVAQSTLLHEFAADPQTKTRAEKVRAAAERCGRIVKSFLGMVRQHPISHAEMDLNTAIRAAIEVAAYGARSSGITVTAEYAEGLVTVLGDTDHITQVAANFLVNSQHALTGIAGDRRIRVRTYRTADGGGGFSVEDNGPGVPIAIRHRIFESYFTTKPAGAGTGIGLSISRAIVERHGGRIWHEEATPRGARFVVELPPVGSIAARLASAQSAAPPLGNALILDDEPDVAGSLADMLELMGVRTRISSSWVSCAVTIGSQPVDIVFSDLRMPGADGIAIYRQLLSERPALARRFVLVTGDMIGARAEIADFPLHQRPQVLEKPFTTLDVRNALSAVSDEVNLPRPTLPR